MSKLNANHLKLVAIFAMTIDHIADLIFPGFPLHPASVALHLIGRITAPVMWFFVCEGFFYTHNVKKYMLRMGIFAVISHFTYCFAFGISMIPFQDGIFNQTSVIWPLFWAVVALWVFKAENNIPQWAKWLILIGINLITFPSDWSCIAVMSILFMYDRSDDLKKQMLVMLFWVAIYAVISYFCVIKSYALTQLGVVLVYPVLKQYNGKPGNAKWMKWFFYLFYPAHLIVVGILRLALYGNLPLLF